MQRSLLVLAILVSLSAGCDSAPIAPEQPALAPSLARAVSSRAPFTAIAQNPCPPVAEAVAIEGFMHIVTKPEAGPDNLETRGFSTTHAGGLGAITGLKYVFQEDVKSAFALNGTPGSFHSEVFQRFHLISQGNTGNSFFDIHFKLECDETGCRVVVIKADAECRA